LLILLGVIGGLSILMSALGLHWMVGIVVTIVVTLLVIGLFNFVSARRSPNADTRQHDTMKQFIRETLDAVEVTP
jgi:hypothetical protein